MNAGWKSLFTVFFGVTLAALLVRLFLFENYRVVSDSMNPTLLEGDFVAVSKFNFNVHVPFSSFELVRWRHPERSEIVLYTLPDHGFTTYAQRVVGVEGDRIEVREGILLVNGKAAHYDAEDGSDEFFFERFDDRPAYRVKRGPGKIENYGPVDVPAGSFFALGDNRTDSSDGRAWGPLPYATLKGKPALIWLSFDPSGQLSKGRSVSRIR
jgi:signal peptidase I